MSMSDPISDYLTRIRNAQMVKKHRTRQWIKNLVIGGVAFYIGYEVGKEEMINKKKDNGLINKSKYEFNQEFDYKSGIELGKVHLVL